MVSMNLLGRGPGFSWVFLWFFSRVGFGLAAAWLGPQEAAPSAEDADVVWAAQPESDSI